MTIPMPEPVAMIGSVYQLLWLGGSVAEISKRTGATVGSHLITTTQAEAYADARVREALEEALQLTSRRTMHLPHYSDFDRGYAEGRSSAAMEIRALLPPLPGPVEPTT